MHRSPLADRVLLAIAFSVTLLTTSLPAQQNTDTLKVGVQSKLDREKLIWNGTHAHKWENPPEHGKIYAILVIQPTDSLRKLIKPVNAADIRDELVKQLEKNGYHHVEPGQKPEILLWVIYGRSWMPTPYATEVDVDNMAPQFLKPGLPVGQTDPDAPPSYTIENPNLAAEISIPRNSHRATELSFEKLFIMVRAFKYPPPPDPKQKPEALWVAMMYVDDPANRDLNLVFKQMLEAGAPFFDKEIKDYEATIWKPLPEGHVSVGAPEVVEAAKTSAK